MKGKRTFSLLEISELRNLIKERINVDKSRQKSIRARMRRIGFYGSDDFGITDMQPRDFEMLIKSKSIIIAGNQKDTGITISNQKANQKTRKLAAHASEKEFILFDPLNHDSNVIPDNPGNYIVCLKKGARLPDIGIKYEMRLFNGLSVIYTGIAGTSLRKRDYRQHFTGNNAGSSTLRKSLGSLYGYPKIPRDKDPSNGKTKFNKSDEIKISDWMRSNLVLFFKRNLDPEELEGKLIESLNPPLNLSKNSNPINQKYRKELSHLRK